MENLICSGQVSSVDPKTHRVRVAVRGVNEWETFDLPVLTHGTKNPRVYHMPRVGEHVTCLFLPNGHEQGFVLGNFYTQTNLPGESDAEIWSAEFEDGTRFVHDGEGNVTALIPVGHLTVGVKKDILIESESEVTLNVESDITVTGGAAMTVKIADSITIEASSVTIKAPVKIEGNVTVDGDITATGDIVAGSISLQAHTHLYSPGPGGPTPTAPPQ